VGGCGDRVARFQSQPFCARTKHGQNNPSLASVCTTAPLPMSNTPPNCPTPAGRRNQWLFVLLSASPDAAARTIHTNRAQRLNAVPKRLCKSNSPKPCSFHRVLACTLPASWMASWEHSLWRAGNDETPFCRSYKGVDWSTGLYASSRHRLGDGVTVWTCSRLTLACEKVTPKGSTDDVGG